MIYTDLTKKAIKLMFEVHKEQKDKTGLPYVFHPFHLAEQMDDEISTVVALLHDVVEDSSYTFEDLINLGFPGEVINALTYLTHDMNVDYLDYVTKIKENRIAMKVKIADLKHNSDMTRLDNPTAFDYQRAEKYKKALAILENNGGTM